MARSPEATLALVWALGVSLVGLGVGCGAQGRAVTPTPLGLWQAEASGSQVWKPQEGPPWAGVDTQGWRSRPVWRGHGQSQSRVPGPWWASGGGAPCVLSLQPACHSCHTRPSPPSTYPSRIRDRGGSQGLPFILLHVGQEGPHLRSPAPAAASWAQPSILFNRLERPARLGSGRAS